MLNSAFRILDNFVECSSNLAPAGTVPPDEEEDECNSQLLQFGILQYQCFQQL